MSINANQRSGHALVHEELLGELVALLEEEAKVRRRIVVVMQRLRVNFNAKPVPVEPLSTHTGIESKCVAIARKNRSSPRSR